MSIAAGTEIRIEDLEFEPPGPGSWEPDLTHWPRPVARFMTEPAAFQDPFARGFIESLRRYGTAILYPGALVRARDRLHMRAARAAGGAPPALQER